MTNDPTRPATDPPVILREESAANDHPVILREESAANGHLVILREESAANDHPVILREESAANAGAGSPGLGSTGGDEILRSAPRPQDDGVAPRPQDDEKGGVPREESAANDHPVILREESAANDHPVIPREESAANAGAGSPSLGSTGGDEILRSAPRPQDDGVAPRPQDDGTGPRPRDGERGGVIGTTAQRVGRLRASRRRRRAAVIGVALVGAFAVGALALTLGAAGLTPGRALAAVVGIGEPGDVFVVHRLRLPRVLAAFFAGAGFALAGAIFQSTLRNPLASPDILGVATGASLGAVTALLTFGLRGLPVAGAAFAGALLAAGAIWFLAWRRGLHSTRFVLVGVGVAYLCGSLLAWLMSRAEVREAQTALVWTIGSVADVRGTPLTILMAGVGALGVVAAVLSRTQAPLALGDDHAAALGVRVHAARAGLLLVAVALVAVATAAAGPVAFVALVCPAIARRLLDDGGAALATSAAVGALLVLTADVLAQHALPGMSVPVGIVTGLVGAPYLLWLLSGRSDRRISAP